MSEPEVLDLVVGEPAHGGACVAREPSGRVVFVRHALPGERVRALVTRRRAKLAWADAVEIVEASPDRVACVWPLAGPGGVGGGELAHVRPEAQRAWKSHVVAGQLRRVGGEAVAARVEELGGVAVRPAAGDEGPGDPLLGRRARIEVEIDGQGRAAMHAHRDSRLVPLDGMPLAAPGITALDAFAEGADRRWPWRPGERVRLLAPTGEAAAFVWTARGLFDAEGERVARDRLEWAVTVGGRDEVFSVRPDGFWQTHVRGADVLASAVERLAGVGEGDRVLELYSGAGLFSRGLGRLVGPRGRVLTLEGVESAVSDASVNCAELAWVEPFVGDVDAEGVDDLAAELGVRPDLVVLDPPRAGAGVEVCEAVASSLARRVVLVSCDPAAGARDLRALVDAGFVVGAFEAWDLFPHTHHVETVALLERR